MFRQIFPVFFLFLCLFLQLCGQGRAAQNVQPPHDNDNGNIIPKFFEPGNAKLKEAIRQTSAAADQHDEIAVTRIGSVFLAAAGDVAVALAEVDYSAKDQKQFILVEKCIETNKEKWSDNVVKSGGNEWKTKWVAKNTKNIKNEASVKSSVVVANGDKIYYFSVNNTTFENVVATSPENSQWHITVAVGNIALREEKEISWNTWYTGALTKNIKLNEKLAIKPNTIPPAVGFGFVIGDDIVFAVQGEEKEETDGKNKYATVFFQFEKGENKLELYHVEQTGNCYPSLFFWEKQIVMTPSACESDGDENQKMKVFDYKQKKFNNSERPIARLQEFLKDKKNFLTTKIGTTTITDVLLFTQQSKEHKIYLWITDGNRTAKVGTIITGDKKNFDLSMLHANNELFVLYNNYETAGSSGATEEKSKYDLKRLPAQLSKIKSMLESWKNADNEIKKFFKKTDTDSGTFLFKDRLVGFLWDNGEDNKYWKDEYFYENATVTSGTKTSGGFKFNGARAGAKWPVKEENKDQPYNFAAFGFTLVATVKIDNDANEKGNSILGVGLGGTNNDKKTIGLWCSGGMWAVGDGKNTAAAKVTSKTCVREEKYRVVLTLKDKEVSVYIDGKLIEGLPKNSIDVQQQPLSISHFYFGVNNAEHITQSTTESHVTVTNVLLYNRPFEEREVKNLKECEKTVSHGKHPDEAKGNTGGGSDGKKEGDKKAPSPSRTEDGGVGGGVRVFSLLLPLLCVSAPLLHL